MEYIKVKLPKCTIFIKPEEIHKLLLKDTELFAGILKRSKYIIRHNDTKRRTQEKYEREQGL